MLVTGGKMDNKLSLQTGLVIPGEWKLEEQGGQVWVS